MTVEIAELEKEFIKVAGLAGVSLSADDLIVESLCAPHKSPSRLPDGKMAVYVFCHGSRVLKIGRVGPNSKARYTSQHYNPKATGSTLAGSILMHGPEIGIHGVTEADVGDWIRANTDRYNFLLDSGYPNRLLTLLESFLQCKLDPCFEGFDSQRLNRSKDLAL